MNTKSEELNTSSIQQEFIKTQFLLNAILESHQDTNIFAIDTGYKYLFLNNVHKKATQEAYGTVIAIGMNMLDQITDAEDRAKAKAHFDRAFSGESHTTSEEYGTTRRSYFETFYNPVYDEKGTVIAATAFSKDITEHKQVEEELLESSERARQFFENNKNLCYMVSLDGMMMDINKSALKVLGYKKQELIGKPLTAIYAPESLSRMSTLLEQWKQTGIVSNEEMSIVTKSGEKRNVLLNVESVRDRMGRIVHSVSVQTDITELKRVHEALRQSETRLSNALSMGKMGHWELDVASNIFTFSDSFYSIFHTTAEEVGGYTMSIEEYAKRFVHPQDAYLVAEETRKALETEDPNFTRYIEHRMLYADGSIGYVGVRFFIIKDDEGKTVKTYGVNQDITERKRTADELEKGQKLESLGLLAGGIAHDFNNLLGGIFGNIDLAFEEITDTESARKYLGRALGAMERAKNLTQQLLTFSKGGSPHRRPVDICSVLRQSQQLSLSGSNIKCTIVCDSAIAIADADENQLSQVFNNVIPEFCI